MLKQRVITAVILAAALAALLIYASAGVFAAAMALVIVLAAWEWGRLSGLSGWQPFAYAALLALLLAALQWQRVPYDTAELKQIMTIAVLGWLPAIIAIAAYPAGTVWRQSRLLLCIGIWLLVPTWLGLLYLHQQAANSGLIWLIIGLIASADIGAYFAGRRFGRHKLAPEVSPGKTWEGAIGGLLAVAALGLVLTVVYGADFAQGARWVVALLLCGTASIFGDLFESMVKRAAGIKDSSQLLPGHGGVMDRIDGWTAAVPVFALLLLWFGI